MGFEVSAPNLWHIFLKVLECECSVEDRWNYGKTHGKDNGCFYLLVWKECQWMQNAYRSLPVPGDSWSDEETPSILLRAVKIFLLFAIPRPQSSHTFLSKFVTNSLWFLSLPAFKPLRILTEPIEGMNLGAPGCAVGAILYLIWIETLECNGKSPAEDNKVLSLHRDGVRRGFCVSICFKFFGIFEYILCYTFIIKRNVVLKKI